MGITKEGIEGEKKLFAWLRSEGYSFFQPDSLGKWEGVWYVFECKHQEMYEAPPFDGHGLPVWQVKARLEFQEDTGIQTMLVVFEKGTDDMYVQLLENLEAGEYIDTKGDKPRRVYNIELFNHNVI